MPTVLGRLGDELYAAFYEPDPDKRRVSLDEWVNRASGAIASHIREELASYVAFLTESRWSEEGWKMGEQKLRRIQPQYHLVMDIKLRPVGTNERPSPLLVELSEPLVPGIDKGSRHTLFKESAIRETSKTGRGAGKSSSVEDSDIGEELDRSPNDDRSDSMNPNNDAYNAAMDNHANQMNPNNDAYWSSRGR